jgi:hypothetical protein
MGDRLTLPTAIGHEETGIHQVYVIVSAMYTLEILFKTI